jgi:hypothetical protein
VDGVVVIVIVAAVLVAVMLAILLRGRVDVSGTAPDGTTVKVGAGRDAEPPPRPSATIEGATSDRGGATARASGDARITDTHVAGDLVADAGVEDKNPKA